MAPRRRVTLISPLTHPSRLCTRTVILSASGPAFLSSDRRPMQQRWLHQRARARAEGAASPGWALLALDPERCTHRPQVALRQPPHAARSLHHPHASVREGGASHHRHRPDGPSRVARAGTLTLSLLAGGRGDPALVLLLALCRPISTGWSSTWCGAARVVLLLPHAAPRCSYSHPGLLYACHLTPASSFPF